MPRGVFEFLKATVPRIGQGLLRLSPFYPQLAFEDVCSTRPFPSIWSLYHTTPKQGIPPLLTQPPLLYCCNAGIQYSIAALLLLLLLCLCSCCCCCFCCCMLCCYICNFAAATMLLLLLLLLQLLYYYCCYCYCAASLLYCCSSCCTTTVLLLLLLCCTNAVL